MSRFLALLLVAALALPGGAVAGGSADDAVDVQALTPLLGVKLHKKHVKRLRPALDDARPAVRALAAAMLYAHDPDAHEDVLAGLFAVDHAPTDEAARVVAHGEIEQRLAELAEAFDGEVPKELEPLMVFLAYKDDPAFFETSVGRTSVARFYRASFLALAWAEAEAKGRLDRTRVLRSIDRAAGSASASASASSE